MRFKVVESYQQIPSGAKECCYLLHTVWDDWFQFQTEYSVYYFDGNGIRSRPFAIKIGRVGLRGCRAEGYQEMVKKETNVRITRLPDSFTELSDEYFSIGTDDSYYEFMGGDKKRREVFVALRDVAYNMTLLRRYHAEDCLNVSLLRGISGDRIRSRFAKLAHGKPALTDFSFTYKYPQEGSCEPPLIDFDVSTRANPPNNIKVVIGRNGVGKTHLLKTLAATLCGQESVSIDGKGKVGRVEFHEGGVYGLVYASFSPFDDLSTWTVPKQNNLVFYALGVASQKSENNEQANIDALGTAFVNALLKCRQDPWRTRWLKCLEILKSDPIFDRLEGDQLLDCAPYEIKKKAGAFFKKLSSGHAALMLIITQLVCVLDEKFLLLVDEPECHLHPPLLSSFVRCLTVLLLERNAIALIATHSPVVLQEVTRDSVWIVNRVGHQVELARPTMETFGESVGILMNEIFGLEFRASGYHRLLSEAVAIDGCTYESVVSYFGGHLGGEAKALLRMMLVHKERGEDSVCVD